MHALGESKTEQEDYILAVKVNSHVMAHTYLTLSISANASTLVLSAAAL